MNRLDDIVNAINSRERNEQIVIYFLKNHALSRCEVETIIEVDDVRGEIVYTVATLA